MTAQIAPPAIAAPISAQAHPGRPVDSDSEALFAAAAPASAAAGAWLVGLVVVVVVAAGAVSVLITVFVWVGVVAVVVGAGVVTVVVLAGSVTVLVEVLGAGVLADPAVDVAASAVCRWASSLSLPAVACFLDGAVSVLPSVAAAARPAPEAGPVVAPVAAWLSV